VLKKEEKIFEKKYKFNLYVFRLINNKKMKKKYFDNNISYITIHDRVLPVIIINKN
jgi:hypothetical protein